MADTPEYEIERWIDAVAGLYYDTVDDETQPAADEAAATLWSGNGFVDAPPDVLQMLAQAVSAGYAAALRDLRAGQLDDAVRGWRPDLHA